MKTDASIRITLSWKFLLIEEINLVNFNCRRSFIRQNNITTCQSKFSLNSFTDTNWKTEIPPCYNWWLIVTFQVSFYNQLLESELPEYPVKRDKDSFHLFSFMTDKVKQNRIFWTGFRNALYNYLNVCKLLSMFWQPVCYWF